ncbi:MAG: type II secretion system protein M [Pseudomonadota bacterium]|nr:type II secretion system protein M [Pseudomonadota bacterium]
MIVAVRDYYGARTQREQRLILLMLGIAVPLLIALLIVIPLGNAYDRALDRHLEAVDRNGRIRQIAEMAKNRPASAPEIGGANLSLIVAESASRAGLTLDSNAAAGGNAVAVTIGAAPAPLAVQWLREFETRGVIIEDLRLAPAANGNVSVSARLAR